MEITTHTPNNDIFKATHPAPFDTMGLFTFLRTYARRHKENDPNSTVESWDQALERVIIACNTQLKVGFTPTEQKELFNLLYDLKCSVAGRFLWQLGTKTVDILGMPSLQNCCFTVVDEPVYPFTWVMNMLMLGSGCVIPSTPILTANGIKPICQVQVNDMVLSYNSKTAATEYKKVLYTHDVIVPQNKNVRITTKHSRVVTSIEHPFLVRRNNEWAFVCAKELKLSDKMRRFLANEPDFRVLDEKTHLLGTRERKNIPDSIKNCYNKNMFMSFLCGLLDMDGFTSSGVTTMIYSTRFESMIDDLLQYQQMYDLCMQPTTRMSVTENHKVAIPLHKLWNYVDFFHSIDKKDFIIADRRKRELLSKPLSVNFAICPAKKYIIGDREYISTISSSDDEHESLNDEIIDLEYNLPYGEAFCDITVDENNSYYTGEGGQVVSHNCGFRILPADIDKLPSVKHSVATRIDTKDADYIVPDSREGWIKLLGKVLKAHFYSGESFTYSCMLLRSKGAPIKGFGGLASGPEVLCEGLVKIDEILNKRAGQVMRPIDALDVMNICGMIVVSGNIRRCLPKGSLVHTSKGLVPIEKIKINDKVLTPTGYHNVNNVFEQGFQRVVTIKTEQGEFECTPNHRMAVIKGDTYEYREVSTLKIGDQLATSRLVTGGELQTITVGGKAVFLDEEMAWFVGYMKYITPLSFPTLKVPDEMISRVKTQARLIKETFSDVQINFPILIPESSINTIDFEHVLTCVCKSPPSVRLAFLSGIADRSYINDPMIEQKVILLYKSELLVKLIQKLFYSCGIETTITGRSSNESIYELSLASEYAINEFRTNPYILSRKVRKREGVFGHTFSMNPVKVITVFNHFSTVETFDIEVDQVHEFFCNGYLTHNSALISMGDCKDQDYLRAKRWDLGNVPNHRAYSNNSVVCNDINEILDNEEFWAGYNGGGEPYGLINLHLSRKCGRLGDTRYPDPNVEGYNPCLPADTWILTKKGPRQISDLIGQKTTIINNGKPFDTTKKGFWKTGEQLVYTIETEEGFSVRATGNHKFMSDNGWIEVQNMQVGTVLKLHAHRWFDGWGSVYDGHGAMFPSDTKPNDDTFTPDFEQHSSDYYNRFFKSLDIDCDDKGHSVIHTNLDKNSTSIMQRMLLRLGIYSKICRYKNRHALETWYPPPTNYVATVKSITPDKIVNVYDCTVPGVNSFDANGFYVHNCAEQSLNNMESCVRGDTLIHTYDGLCPIKELIGKKVKIYNGEVWSEVVPFRASDSSTFTEITFSDGSSLVVTDGHEFSVSTKTSKTNFRKKKTIELEVGMYMPKLELGMTEFGETTEWAYTLGAFTGDGYMDGGRPRLCANEKCYQLLFDSCKTNEKYNRMWKKDERLMYMYRTCLNPGDFTFWKDLRDYEQGLPKYIMNFSKKSILEFIAGWIDTDGSIRNKGLCGEGYIICGGNKKKLGDAQILLRRTGINFATLRMINKKGEVTNYGTRNHDMWVLQIPTFECREIPTILKPLSNFGERYKKNNAYKESKPIDSAPRQTIVKIERLANKEPSYCFTEPLRHMGVFGNVLTYQCCLGELFLPNIKSEEELRKCATYIYRICKHSLRLPCKDSPGMEAVVHKNMRMGIGITGYLQATEEKRKWLPACYEYLREYDIQYSAKHSFPVSIKLTTCKPSGTLSLLGGVTSGVHPAYSQYYIRRIRISSNSPLIAIAKKHGYPIEYARNFDGTNIHDTQIISFPHMVPLGTILAENCTAISQLEWVKRLQTEWSDNSVSVTVYYRKEELPAIKQWLKENYNDNVKTVSFLLHNDHGFDQAPLEQITKEQYEELISKCMPITSTAGVCYTVESEEIISQQECAGGVCPMR